MSEQLIEFINSISMSGFHRKAVCNRCAAESDISDNCREEKFQERLLSYGWAIEGSDAKKWICPECLEGRQNQLENSNHDHSEEQPLP